MSAVISWSRAHGGQCILRLSGDIDLVCRDHLLDAVEVLTGQCVEGYVVDLSDVTFMDCTGLNALVALQAAAAGMDRPVVLVRPPTVLVRMLDVLRLADRLPRARSVTEAARRVQELRAPVFTVPGAAHDDRAGRR